MTVRPYAFLIAVVATVAVIGTCSCRRQPQPAPGPAPPVRPEPPKPEPVEVDPDLVSANTTFGFKLFDALREERPDENLFISPSSVAFALAMTYNGAAGETKDAMADALELGDMSLEQLNDANASLMASLKGAEPAVELSIANSLWAKEGVEFLPDFLSLNEQYYQAQVTELDFTDPAAPDTINKWVSEQTRGKIPTIAPTQMPRLAILFLINAIYFKGEWAEKFDKEDIKDDTFTLLDGSEKTLPMMSQYGEFPYFDGDGFQAISLPYQEDRVSMCIFLPDEDSSLAELCSQLDAETWESWVGELRKREGTIELPRFTIEYEATLNEPLKALGMEVAFDEHAADFTNMCTSLERVWIGGVKHKTFVEVNEEGTEAAAATAVMMEGVTAAAPVQPFHMVVDRPFFCAIRDHETGTVLFMGAIVDPGGA